MNDLQPNEKTLVKSPSRDKLQTSVRARSTSKDKSESRSKLKKKGSVDGESSKVKAHSVERKKDKEKDKEKETEVPLKDKGSSERPKAKKPSNVNYHSMHSPVTTPITTPNSNTTVTSQQPRIRITSSSSKNKQNPAYYSCPTKKLMEDDSPHTLPSMNTVQLPNQDGPMKLNEHPLSYSNVRIKETTHNREVQAHNQSLDQQSSPETVNFSHVKVSDFVGVNSPKSLVPDVKRVRLHKKSSSDQSGVAPELTQIHKLKEIYQTERQRLAERFLLDFIESDETSLPAVKSYLIVKCLDQWFSTDLMNNIIKSCEASMEKNQLSRKKIFSWASTITHTWYFSQCESTHIVTNQITFLIFVKKIESTLSNAFEHTWNHFLTNMDHPITNSIAECLRNMPDVAVQHYSSLEEALRKLLEYSALIKDTFIIPSLVRQFFIRIFQWLMNIIVSTIHKEGSSASHSIQMKVIITELMEFSRKVGYYEIAQEYLTPANEISNMLSYQNKHLLSDKKEREDVCPTLSPRLMASVLENYSHSNKEAAISKPYLEELRAQENLPNQHELHYSYQPLELEFGDNIHIDVGKIVIPSQFLEHPGFEFLQSS